MTTSDTGNIETVSIYAIAYYADIMGEADERRDRPDIGAMCLGGWGWVDIIAESDGAYQVDIAWAEWRNIEAMGATSTQRGDIIVIFESGR